MKIGELLLQDGVINAAQLRSALEQQRANGGRLGTNLFEQGAVDIDTLARALARQQKVLPALEQQMENITAPVLAMVPAKLAEKHRAVPIHFDPKPTKKLYVAFVNPHDISAIDELGFKTGSRIVSMIAPELSIAFLLEKHYGVLRDRRLMRVHPTGGTLQEGIELDNFDDDLPEDPDVDPRFAPPTAAAMAAAAAAPKAPPAEAPSFFTPRSTTNEFSMPEAEHTDPMFAAPGFITGVSALIRTGLTLEDTSRAIAVAKNRDEIGTICMEFLRPLLTCGLVLFCKDGLALGWRGYSPGVDAAAFEAISLPLSGASSVFSMVYETRSTYAGPPPSQGATLHSRLWKLLRCPSPTEIAVVPVLIKDRVVALIYGHNQEGPIGQTLVSDLGNLASTVADGFARIIQESKRKTTDRQP